MAANVEYLRSVVDPFTNAVLYTFSKGTEIDLGIKRPASIIKVPDLDGGINVRPGRPNPMDARTLLFKFWHTMLPNETHAQAKTALITAIGNRWVQFNLLYPDGTTRWNTGVLTDLPDPVTVNTMLSMIEFTPTFQLDHVTWRGNRIGGTITYDAGYQYDTGLLYDNSTSIVPLLGGSTTLNLTNNGDAPERSGVYTIIGPAGGPITLTNYSVPLGGSGSGAYYESMYWSGPLTATGAPSGGPDTLTIDSGASLVLLNGFPAFGNPLDASRSFFAYGNGAYPQREFMLLASGFNGLILAHAGAAAAHATLSGGGVASVIVDTAGTDYATPPAVVLIGGGGSGATATCTVSGGGIATVTVTAAGSGYTSAPTVGFDNGSRLNIDSFDTYF